MKIIDCTVFCHLFEFDNNSVSDAIIMAQYDEYLEKVRIWAGEHYPDSAMDNRLSFATLIMYFVCDYYAGYATEADSKARVTEQKVCAFYNHYYKEMSSKDISERVISICIDALLRH